MGVFDYFVVQPLQSNGDFRQGFVTALVIVTVLFLVSRPFLRLWNRISGFFKPGKEVVTKDGKSAFSTLLGCIGAVGSLAVLAMVAAIFVALAH